MKLICLQENLNHALITGEKIISRSVNLPILSNMLLETDQGRLKIASTNLEIGITSWVGGKIEKEGAIAVPAKLLTSFISNLPNKKVELEVNENVLNIKCESMKADIKGLSPQDFPLIPEIKDTPFIKMKSQVLKNAFNQVISAAANSETRPEITGMFFNFNDLDSGKLVFAATDSYRLAEKTIKLDSAAITKEKKQENGAIIIPKITIQEVIRILPEESEVSVSIADNQILFNFGNVNLVSRLIEGAYPDYKQIIPAEFKTKTIVNTEEFIKAIKVASIFTDTKANNVCLNIKPEKTLEISAEAGSFGSNLSSIDAEIKGEKEKIIFNWRYVLDGLSNISAEKVILETNGSNSPALLKPIGNEDYIYLIMPIKN